MYDQCVQCGAERVRSDVLQRENQEDQLDAAQVLVSSASAGSPEHGYPAIPAAMAAVELQTRQRIQVSAGGAASVSGRESGEDLPACLLGAYKAMGHMMSCASELR